MALDDHLGTNQNISLFISESLQDLFMAILGLCGIHVHPEDPGTWKLPLHQFFNLLGAGLEAPDIW